MKRVIKKQLLIHVENCSFLGIAKFSGGFLENGPGHYYYLSSALLAGLGASTVLWITGALQNRCAPEPPKPPKFLFQQWPFVSEVSVVIVNSGILETDTFDSENKQFSIVFVAFLKSTTLRRQAATNDCETYKIL